MKLYEITADYRPNNPDKPKYYVYGENKIEAKQRFSKCISWLKIYEVTELDEATAEKIISEPMKHIVI